MIDRGEMQDEVQTQPLVMAPPARSGRGSLLIALIAFLLGAALAGWLVWNGSVDPAQVFGRNPRQPVAQVQAPSRPAGTRDASPAPAIPHAAPAAQLGAVETRLALLEDRMSRLTLQAEAASGNAARAEGLLIAFAARRTLDRGAPLGYLEDQLRLRFADAQPNAVNTIIAAGQSPVTLDQLLGQLQVAGPKLARAPADEDAWTRIRRELHDLFIIRRDSAPATTAMDRVERARLMLAAGNVEGAIAEVQRLPGAADARDWIIAARRYDAAHRALDLIETAAMLEPRRLKDGNGTSVQQATPLAPAGTEIPASPASPAA